MEPNTIVKLKNNDGMKISLGRLAIVVQGKDIYPELYQKLSRAITKTCGVENAEQYLSEFIAIEWLDSTILPNGFYHSVRFEKVKNIAKA